MAFLYPASGSSSPVNPDYLPLSLNPGATGGGTQLTSGGSSHTKGSYASLGTLSSAISEFTLEVFQAQGSGNRYVVYLSTNNGSTDFIRVVAAPSSSGGVQRFRVPLALASSTTIYAAVSASSSNQTVYVGVTGLIPQGSGNPPGFTTATEILAIDTANTQASATGITIANSVGYTVLEYSTATQYGAFLLFFSATSAPTNNQATYVRLATGAELSEVPIWGGHMWVLNSITATTGRFAETIAAEVASAQRLSLSILGATGGDNTLRVGLIGFS